MSAKYQLQVTGQFKRDLKRCKKRGLPMEKLWEVISHLLNDEPLEEKYHAHVLTGDRKGQWECHIEPNWLLIWKVYEDKLILVMLNTGTHSDLFGKNYKK